MNNRFFYLILTLLFLVPACTTAPTPDPEEFIVPMATVNTTDLPTIADALAQEPNAAFWFTALTRIGMVATLQQENSFTLLVPTNAAFAENFITPSQIDEQTLQNIAQLHVLNQAFTVEQLNAASQVQTMSGYAIPVNQEENAILIDYIQIDSTPVHVQNGTIYFVDGLLLPKTGDSIWNILIADERLTTLSHLLRDTPLMYSLSLDIGPDAILAPTNDAFAAMSPDVFNAIQADYSFLTFWMGMIMLTPDGWPEGKPLTLAELSNMEFVKTSLPVSGSGFGYGYEEYPITTTDNGLMIGEMHIIKGDLIAKNGTVHIVDLVPVSQRILDSLTAHDD